MDPGRSMLTAPLPRPANGERIEVRVLETAFQKTS